jgi:hypothetical protein
MADDGQRFFGAFRVRASAYARTAFGYPHERWTRGLVLAVNDGNTLNLVQTPQRTDPAPMTDSMNSLSHQVISIEIYPGIG